MSTDYFVGFGKCLGKDEAELGKVWNEALGRYDRAVLNLVVDVLQEAQNPEEKLCNALNEMKTPESAKHAAIAIQNGKLQYCLYVYWILLILRLRDSVCSLIFIRIITTNFLSRGKS